MCIRDRIADIQRPLLGVEGAVHANTMQRKAAPLRPQHVVPTEAPAPLSRTFPPPAVDEETRKQHPVPPTASRVKGALIESEDPTMVVGRNDPLFARINSSDCKAKMYFIVQALELERFEGLSPEDQLKLPLMNCFEELKESEVWHDIQKELQEEDVRPVSPDRSWLEAQIESSERVALEVQSVQRTLVKDIEEQEVVDQEHFLEGIAETMHKDIRQTIRRGRAMIMAKKGMGGTKQ
eukprot:TRINITY_DN6827_c0_g1_i4.p2 TRINITY_DN6827_c0_g1~~TRINITY_DN6827_c0_g1_i4.p2  ORF type:complete len:237 (+),score=68.26 TRINITY_DN6827_c0_g1_i4:109-819(+)